VSGGMNRIESAGSVLKRIVPDLMVSKQKLRQAEGCRLVRLKREEGKQNLGFSSRPFVLCGLPIRKPPKENKLYERRNGNFVLQITGHPEYGLPFGQDRIVPIYLATLAVRQQSQTIRFRTAAEMLETFDMHKGGKEYRRLVAAFERIFGATIFFGTDSSSGRAKVVQRSRFNFFREAQIWYSRDLDQCPLSEQFENVIVLSDEFYREISAHAIPADLEAVKVLASAPAVLDLFMWLSYRCFLAKGQETIPLLGPFGLAGQIGSIEYARPRRFREKLDQWLQIIYGLWPECPVRISSDGVSLIVDRAHAVLTEQKIGRQGENQKNDAIVVA
jgi:Plasmid encoded RepA protein